MNFNVREIEVCNQDLWIMLISTMRYSMGPRTYMSSYAPELVQRYKRVLSKHQLIQLAKEVKFELNKEKNYPGHMGMACDVENWRNFESWLLEEIEKREVA